MNRERSPRVGLDLRLSQADLALRLHGEHADANPRDFRGRRARAFKLNPARNRQTGPKRERHVDNVLPVDDNVGPVPSAMAVVGQQARSDGPAGLIGGCACARTA